MTEQDTPKMTHDEMIDVLKGLVFGTFDRTTAKEREALDMAISALSADGEYIKKEDAIAEFTAQKDAWEYYGESFYNEKYIKFDDVIQSINGLATYSFPDSAENKWIPVSERLPEKEKENYLIDYEYEGEEHITVSFYDKYGFWSSSEVKAWQPLPEPYKAESEGTE